MLAEYNNNPFDIKASKATFQEVYERWSKEKFPTISKSNVKGSVVSFSLIMQSIVDIGPSKSSMLASSEPLSATVFSVLWLWTSFSGTDLIGFAAIISTIFLLTRPDKNTAS